MSNVNNEWILKIVKTSEFTNTDDIPVFDQQKLMWIDAVGQKHEEYFRRMNEGGKHMETILTQLARYKVIADDAGWTSDNRFNNWERCLGGEAQEIWQELMDEGHDLWDSNDRNNVQDFDNAIKAWLCEMTDELRTGNVQQQSIMNATYKNLGKRDGVWMKPSKFWRRKAVLWKYSQVMHRVGAAVTDVARLTAEHDGLTQDMRDWLKDDAEGTGHDVFDAENNGADMWTPADLYETLNKYWLKIVKEEKKSGGRRGKRGNNGNNNNNADDDNDQGNGQGTRNSNGKRRHNNNNNNGQRKRQKGNYNQGNYNQNGSDRNRNGSDFDKNTCPIHGGHNWGACRLNHRNTKSYDQNQADNYYRRNSNNEQERAKAPWWFTGYERKNKINNNGNNGGQHQYHGGPPQQQQYYGGQPHHHQQQQPNGSYFQAPGGAPPSFGGSSIPPPPAQQVGSYATSGPSSGPPRAPITKTMVWNDRTQQWM